MNVSVISNSNFCSRISLDTSNFLARIFISFLFEIPNYELFLLFVLQFPKKPEILNAPIYCLLCYLILQFIVVCQLYLINETKKFFRDFYQIVIILYACMCKSGFLGIKLGSPDKIPVILKENTKALFFQDGIHLSYISSPSNKNKQIFAHFFHCCSNDMLSLLLLPSPPSNSCPIMKSEETPV